MQIGMLGLQVAGKKTLFKLMTGASAKSVPEKGLPGKFRVLDPRVDELSRMYQPEKTTYARVAHGGSEGIYPPDLPRDRRASTPGWTAEP